MLNAEEKKLRWGGMDLRPRLRRRVVVPGTYFVPLVLMMCTVSSIWFGRWALQRIGGLLAMYAGFMAVQREPMPQAVVSGFLWGFSLPAWTLPQARVLWTERDPREVNGEMELVERAV